MPNKRVQIFVRCEDLQQHCFIYRYLIEKGFRAHSIDIRHNPGGDAKRYVLDQYPIQVKALRSRPHLSKALISLIDADDVTVEQRKRQHDDALLTHGQDQRADAEPIAILVPKRNIETWIHFLLGEDDINEQAEYPRFRGEERKCAPAATEFARRCPNNIRADDLPSLRDACVELQRIEA